MLGISFAILCAILISFSQISLRKSYKELKPSIAFLFDALFGLLIWIPLAYFLGISETVNWSQAFFYATVSAVLSEAIVFYALSHGELSVTTTVLATYPVYTIILSRILLGEILPPSIYAFVFLAIIGSIAASLPNKLSFKDIVHKGIIWPFVAALCIGLSDTISKGYINKSGDFSFLFALGIIQIPVALIYLKIEKESFVKAMSGVRKTFGEYKHALAGGLFNIVGTGCLWLSFSFAPASIASPLTGTSGALTVVLSRLILKEKISKRKYVGIILAFVGIIGIVLIRSKMQ